jgi:hypothetical protein
MKLLVTVFVMLLGLQMAMAEEELTDYEKGLRDGMQRVGYGAEAKPAESIDQSQKNRADKNFMALLYYGYDYERETNQIGFFKFLSPNQLVGLRFGYRKHEESYDAKTTQTNLSAEFRQFVSNSFYLAGDINYLRYDHIDYDFPEDLNEAYRGIGAGFRIGNQWFWKNITVGVDWIGIGQKIIHFRKEGDPFKGANATLLNLHVGVSF